MRKINYPLIISDFDGTLVNADGSICQENKCAIRKYLSAGGIFALSTGRMPDGILSRAWELGLSGTVSCCQGAVILDIQTTEVYADGRIPLETTVAVCEKMEELDLHIHVYDLWEYYSNKDDEFLKRYEKTVGSKGIVVSDMPISQFVKEKGICSYKILAMVAPEDNQRVMDALSACSFDGCSVTRSADILVEVVNSRYSKGTAVEFLAERYNVPIERTIAIGDQLNDLPMVERAGLGIAVKNADSGLKKLADYISEYTNEEGAVAQIIEKFGFYKGE